MAEGSGPAQCLWLQGEAGHGRWQPMACGWRQVRALNSLSIQLQVSALASAAPAGSIWRALLQRQILLVITNYRLSYLVAWFFVLLIIQSKLFFYSSAMMLIQIFSVWSSSGEWFRDSWLLLSLWSHTESSPAVQFVLVTGCRLQGLNYKLCLSELTGNTKDIQSLQTHRQAEIPSGLWKKQFLLMCWKIAAVSGLSRKPCMFELPSLSNMSFTLEPEPHQVWF